MHSNYRASDNIKEIIKIISNPENLKDSIIWQNQSGKRFIYTLNKIVVNPRFMSFVADINGNMLPFFNSDILTYCKLTHKGTVFKVSIVNIVNSQVTFNIPKEVQTLELRADPRQKFKPSDGKYITIQVGVELIAKATQSLKFQVIDVSENGVSIVVSDKNIRYFEDGVSFKLTTLMDYELIPKIDMELIYFQQLKFKQKGRVVTGYRVGLKFKKPLTTMQLSNFY